jgi:hypothetical protein
MSKSAIDFLRKELEYFREYEQFYTNRYTAVDNVFRLAKDIEKTNKLEYQLFIGKVEEIIGFEKTLELLRNAKDEIKNATYIKGTEFGI